MKRYLGYAVFSGVCVALWAFFSYALVGYGFLGLCALGLGALGGVFWVLKALSAKKPGAARALRRVVWGAVILCLVAVAITEAAIISVARAAATAPGHADYAIVLGAGVHGTRPSRSLKARLETALEFSRDDPEAYLVLSGGQGPGEEISEAQCMYLWLTERGVSPDRLILEERAGTTEENLEFSRQIIEDRGDGGGSVCVITAYYHVARAVMMAKDAGFEDVSARGASTGMPVLEVNYYLREAPAIWWYLVSG